MLGSMDMDYDYDMPGGDDFDDVTNLFYHAAKGVSSSLTPLHANRPTFFARKEMHPEDVILTEGFSLTDAMSAFEVATLRLPSERSSGS